MHSFGAPVRMARIFEARFLAYEDGYTARRTKGEAPAAPPERKSSN